MTTTNASVNNQFFEVRLSIYGGSNERAAYDKTALSSMGFNGIEFDAVKAILSATVLPKTAFHPFLAVRKSVQEFMASKGVNHDLVGRIFNPEERLEIIQILNEQKERYNQAKEVFLANYEKYKAEQLEVVHNSAKLQGINPTPFVEAVKNAQPKRSYYEHKLEFRYLDLGITLDSEAWAEELERINSDIVARTEYEAKRDSEEIRDTENPRSKAKAILSLASRFKSLDFYVPGLKAIADEIESLVKNVGGIKPAKDYETKEVMMLTGVAKVVSQNASGLVTGSASLTDLMDVEATRIEAMFADEEQEAIDIAAASKLAPVESVESKAVETKVSTPADEVPVAPLPPQKPAATAAGTFNF